MLTQRFAWKAALAAVLLGAAFFVANVYFDGRGHRVLANASFVLAALCNLGFLVFAVLWVFIKSWTYEAPRPGAAMPGPKPGGIPGAILGKKPGAMPAPMPGAENKPPPPAR